MGYPGSARSTAAQRAEVRRLRGEGWSIRAVASEVFGDRRYRGRVERILRKPVPARPAGTAVEGIGLEGLSDRAALRVLYERRLAEMLAAEVPPSMNEVHRMLDVGQRLDALAEQERRLARHRERRERPASRDQSP
jgi:hypothetical protein